MGSYRSAWGYLAGILFSLSSMSAASAAILSIANGDVAGLKNAITTANSNGEDDTINLATNGTYIATAADNTTNGSNAFPVFATDSGHSITINGNGARISRSGSVLMRFFCVNFSTVTITNVIFTNASVPTNGASPTYDGGAILNYYGTLTVQNCTFSGNYAVFGAGICNYGENGAVILNVSNSTFTGNSGTGGSGIDNDGIGGSATVNLTNCTLSANTAISEGAAISTFGYSNGAAPVTLVHCTVSNNAITNFDGGIYALGATVTISNSILASNNYFIPVLGTQAGMGAGVFISNGYNVANDGEAGYLNAIGDQLYVDPRLAPLADNGGPTQTEALMNGSPAIDAGSPTTAVATDERGIARPVDANGDGWSRSDAGAYEKQATDTEYSLVVTTLDDHDDGVCDAADCTLREAINAANAKGGGAVTFKVGLSGMENLTSALPSLSKNIALYGPGAKIVTVTRSSGGDYRLLNITSGVSPSSTPVPVAIISGLALTNGKSDHGAAILDDHADVTMRDCVVSGNTDSFGGAVFAEGSSSGLARMLLIDCTLSGNSGAVGAALYLDGVSTSGFNGVHCNLANCTLSTNSATTAGGAIYANGYGGAVSGEIFNCTFSGNSAPTAGALCTDSENSGEVFLDFSNTIFAKGASGANFGTSDGSTPATSYSEGHNISNDAAFGPAGTGPGGVLNGAGDQRNTNPLLDTALKDNGGDTPTIALLANSPAIDAGNTDLTRGTARDQRGYLRSSAPDIGAFEFNGVVPPVPTPTPTPSSLGNISTRLAIQTGDNVLIGGFIITGTQAKKIIVRGLGPSLPVPGALADPYLELHDSSGNLLVANDNWVDASNEQAIIDSTVAPTNDLESAILTTLPANNNAYTAIVKGNNDTTGIGLTDIYDLDSTVDSRLGNISTRGLVQGGDNVMIGGFIVVGATSQKVIIRAIGPSLPVNGALADPYLELHDGNGALLEANDNWMDSPNKQAIIDSTIPPSNNSESAIVRTLTPGNYTAIVSGVNGTTGIALTEVYALQ